MYIGLWAFLSICVVAGILMIMLVIFLNHRKSMKQMEIEELNLRIQAQKTEVNKS
jgi:cell division protein FtsL